jgi:hypothetical protein
VCCTNDHNLIIREERLETGETSQYVENSKQQQEATSKDINKLATYTSCLLLTFPTTTAVRSFRHDHNNNKNVISTCRNEISFGLKKI